ncbi:MAG: type I glyceraldehyde-3-phosphate dehydrogenase [Epsilonproteobacteria bacterium]|nr:MAG: type I glyceraldehyde-3-phosphate dehydrogenase [Campylobacterota bacterium]RLA66436.1 MAG: type I glyceraldehyde-3-phosphate dehydrogenase [Campylobacterota bacterium]
MSKVKVGINGMGRIGRTILREIFNSNHPLLEVVAVNNPGFTERYVHLLRYDSCHGKFNKTVEQGDGYITIDGKKVRFFNHRDPAEIPWEEVDVDIVIDGTGIFKDKEALGRHIKGSVKKVIMCAPGKDLDGTFVFGVNHKDYDPKNHQIISNASCTTNCLAPVAKVIHDTFGIESALMTTIHSYTLDQKILDASHSDLRRARAGAVSMIPTTTGAAKALGMIIPDLKGKVDGLAIRVPTPNVSIVDLSVTLKKAASVDEINAAFKKAADSELKGILAYTEEELVSIDYMSSPFSSTIDSKLTYAIGRSAKIIAWYDNEFGFSNRVIDLTTYVAENL